MWVGARLITGPIYSARAIRPSEEKFWSSSARLVLQDDATHPSLRLDPAALGEISPFCGDQWQSLTKYAVFTVNQLTLFEVMVEMLYRHTTASTSSFQALIEV